MQSFETILALTPEKKRETGVEHTPAEIRQQPATWRKTVDVVLAKRDALRKMIADLKKVGGNIVLAGAGTSEFIGQACEGPLRVALGVNVNSHATTDIVTHSESIFTAERRHLLVSFARSGDSPESVAAWHIAHSAPNVEHLTITCNAEGELSRLSDAAHEAGTIVLPPETNDKSLVMTSSFSNMVIAALGLSYIDTPQRYRDAVDEIAEGATGILRYADQIGRFAEKDWTRGVFLGSGPLFGVAREAHLKVLESTDGRVMTRFDSYLGLRHGPKSAINDQTFVVAFVSGDPLVQEYEYDLLADIKAQNKSGGIMVVTEYPIPKFRELADVSLSLFEEPGRLRDSAFRIASDILVPQTLALYLSLSLGLKPDSPSRDGTIARVVEGVRIYDHERYARDGVISAIEWR